MDAKRRRTVTLVALVVMGHLTVCATTALTTWSVFEVLGTPPRWRHELSDVVAARSAKMIGQLQDSQTAMQHDAITLGGQVSDVGHHVSQLAARLARMEAQRDLVQRLRGTQLTCEQAVREVQDAKAGMKEEVKDAVQEAIELPSPPRPPPVWKFWRWHWR